MAIISTSGDLFAYGKSTSGMLRPDNVVFYHPADDSTEYTTLSSWSGDASFVNGKISQAMTSSFSLGTFGAESQFDNLSVKETDIAALNSTKFVMVWEDTEQSKIGIVSGSTITYGPNYDFAPGASSISVPHLSSFNEDTFVVAFENIDLGDGSSRGTVKIGTVAGPSGTTISYSTKFDFQPNSGTAGASQDVAVLDDTTFVVTYQDKSDASLGKAIIGTRSGTDVTYGSGFVFSSGSATSVAVTRLSATTFAVCFVDAGNGGRFNVRIGTIDGYNITYGDWVEFIANGSQADITALSSTSFVTALRFGGGGTRGECRLGTVSGDVITAGDAALFDDGNANMMGLTTINSNTFVVAYRDGSAPNHSYVKMGTISDGIITLSDELKFFAGVVSKKNVLAYLPGTDTFVVSYVKGFGKSKINTMAGFSSLSGVNPILYPSTSGNDRIVTCLWGENPTEDTTSVTIERGYSIDLTSTSISLGVTTAVWNDAGIAAVMSGLNVGLSHFLVLDLENTSGTTWNLKTSLDGSSFVDQGIQSSGTQALVTTDTLPQISISGVSLPQWVDEVVLWGGDKGSFTEFTEDELIRLYQLAQIHNEPMDQFDQHGVVVSGVCNLFINSHISPSGSGNLFTYGHESIAISGDLFTQALDIFQASGDLYTQSHEDFTTSEDLFINGYDIISGSTSLFIFAPPPDLFDIRPFYMNGLESILASGDLFTHGHNDITTSGDLSTTGHINQSASGDLFILVPERSLASGDLFICGHNVASGSSTLVIFAPPPDLFDVIRLYISGPESISISGDLFVAGHQSFIGDLAKLYWTDRDTDNIRRCNSDGSNVEVLVSGLSEPRGIAINTVDGKMYWLDSITQKIQRANLDGSSVENLITGLSIPTSIDVDMQNGKMYWADRGTFKIQRANIDGSDIQDLVTSGLSFPHGVALDVVNGKVYWTDNGTDKIQRANLDGSNVEDLVTSGLISPESLKLDVNNNKMYWSDFGTDKIQRANLDGSNIEDLVTTGLDITHGIALDLIKNKIYWVDNGIDKIQRANLDGSNIEDVLTSGLLFPDGLAINYINNLSMIELSIPLTYDLTFDSADLFIKADDDVSAKSIDWLLRSSDHHPQIIGTLDGSVSSVTIQVWDVTDGQNTLLSLASGDCYAIGDTGRWGWSTIHLPVLQRYIRHYFYLMTSNLGGTFDGQFILDVPESLKWIHPSVQSEYLL